jgi:hypothetical protein
MSYSWLRRENNLGASLHCISVQACFLDKLSNGKRAVARNWLAALPPCFPNTRRLGMVCHFVCRGHFPVSGCRRENELKKLLHTGHFKPAAA